MTRGLEALVDGHRARGLAAGTVARVRSVLARWGRVVRVVDSVVDSYRVPDGDSRGMNTETECPRCARGSPGDDERQRHRRLKIRVGDASGVWRCWSLDRVTMP